MVIVLGLKGVVGDGEVGLLVLWWWLFISSWVVSRPEPEERLVVERSESDWAMG